MADEYTEWTTPLLVEQLGMVSEQMEALAAQRVGREIKELSGAVSYLARVLVVLVEECAAQKQALLHVETRLEAIEGALGGILSDYRRARALLDAP